MIDTTKGFTLVRELEASPQEVWSAWTEPDEAARWYATIVPVQVFGAVVDPSEQCLELLPERAAHWIWMIITKAVVRGDATAERVLMRCGSA